MLGIGSGLMYQSNSGPFGCPYIGDTHQGGVVFYLGNGCSGLIASPYDNQTGTDPFGCQGTSISTETSIYTGAQNTQNILDNCATGGIAARVVTNLTIGGYNDWYLPSKDELYLMYQLKTTIGGFATFFYWSSSESTATKGWIQNFGNGGFPIQMTYNKSIGLFVRAIRAF